MEENIISMTDELIPNKNPEETISEEILESAVLERDFNEANATDPEERASGCETSEKNPEALSLDKMVESIDGLSKKIDVMNLLFTRKIQHTAHEEKIVDQMHAELQKYKEDMYSQLIRPILLEIIEMRNSILRVSKTYAARQVEEQNIPLKVFSDYAYDVQDILEKNNISIYECTEVEPFNPIKQRAIKKVNTPAEELHGKVAESLSPGYDYLGKTISPEKVVVYFYEQQQEQEKGDN